MAASPAPSPSPSPSYDLEITVISAKHLKNVNWRSGDLKPYAVAYLHADRRSATKPDDSGSTRPVWNERLCIPLPVPFSPNDPHLLLTLDVFHSKPSETPKPLVGSARIPLKELIDPDNFLSSTASNKIKTIELNRPSGRPQGKVRIKISIHEKPISQDPVFQFPPPPLNYPYHYPAPRDAFRGFSPPPPPPPQHIMPYSHPIPPPHLLPPPYSSYSNPYPGNYYSSPPPYYAAPPPVESHVPVTAPPPARSYYGGPSAPVDYPPGNPNSNYDQRNKSGKFGVGAVAGGLGAMALEEEKVAEKVESDRYSEYRSDY